MNSHWKGTNLCKLRSIEAHVGPCTNQFGIQMRWCVIVISDTGSLYLVGICNRIPPYTEEAFQGVKERCHRDREAEKLWFVYGTLHMALWILVYVLHNTKHDGSEVLEGSECNDWVEVIGFVLFYQSLEDICFTLLKLFRTPSWGLLHFHPGNICLHGNRKSSENAELGWQILNPIPTSVSIDRETCSTITRKGQGRRIWYCTG